MLRILLSVILIFSLTSLLTQAQDLRVCLDKNNNPKKCDIFDIPLPVELLYFTSTPNSLSIDLKWSTATEHNSDSYTIERSFDAVNWTAIAWLKAAGNSNTKLEYSHTYKLSQKEAVSHTIYFRLLQRDLDGVGAYYMTAVTLQGTMWSERIQLNRRNSIGVFYPKEDNVAHVDCINTAGQLLNLDGYPAGKVVIVRVVLSSGHVIRNKIITK